MWEERSRNGARLANVLALILGCVVAATGAVAWADDSEMGAVGGGVMPIRTADIRLDAETVQAVCYRDLAEYRVDFRFVNDGEPRQVLLGFPFSLMPREPGDTVGAARPVGFAAWQGSKPLAVRVGHQPTGSFDQTETPGYLLHEATFPAGPSMITVSYLSSPNSYAGERGKVHAPTAYRKSPSFSASYEYWLRTGAGWKGDIGTAVVRYRLADTFQGWGVDLKPSQLTEDTQRFATRPSGYFTPMPRAYAWVFRNFEPTAARPDDPWSASRYDITFAYSDPVTRADYSLETMTKASSTSTRTMAPVRLPGEVEPQGGWPAPPPLFVPYLIVDGVPHTSWAEGAPGAGVGEWISVELEKEQPVAEVRIVTGDNSDWDTFARRGRAKSLAIEFSDGTKADVALADAPGLQRFPVKARARWAKLTITDAYPGSGPGGDETCISEVEFGAERAPGFAAFDALIGNPAAAGDLPAAAGAAPRGVGVGGSGSAAAAAGEKAEGTAAGGTGRGPCSGAFALVVAPLGLIIRRRLSGSAGGRLKATRVPR